MEGAVSFGGWVRRLRRARDLTQAELGEGVGCSHETIRKIEADGRRPSREIAECLAAQFGLQGADRERFLRAARGAMLESPPPPQVVPPPVAPAPARRSSNLPAPLSSFVGRTREQAAVRHELALARLLTLTGPGGAGKTRLATEVARALGPAYPGGVWLVALAQLTDPALVPGAVLEALGAQARPGQRATSLLVELLGEGQALLVLDNCEHLVEACAGLAGELLAACPGLRVLATSREPLRLAGEVVWRVPPLATPDPARLPPVDDLLLYDAVRLFAERARAVRPDFAPRGDELLAIAGICAAVDGLPLAVELAAAWARVLGVEQIAARLKARLRLLVSLDRSAPARHQTLRATLDWSYELLGGQERALFRRLAVFAGGFTVEAAETVGAGDGVEPDEVLHLLALLVDRSLVVAEPAAGGSWYGLLETVREYAAARLGEAGEAQAVAERHLGWCLAVAEPGQRYQRGELHAALSPWHDNMRAALAYALRGEDGAGGDPAPRGLELAFLISRFWELCGHLSEGRRWLAEAIGCCSAPTVLRARAMWMAGNLAKTQGDIDEAEACYRGAMEWYQEHRDDERIAGLLGNLGNLALERGDYEEARDLYEEALALRRAGGAPGAIGSLIYNLGELASREGDYRRARALFEESLALYRQAGDAWAVADVTGAAGWLIFLEGGDPSRAAALLGESVAAMRAMGTLPSVVRRLIQIGDVAWASGDAAGAASSYRQCLDLLRGLHLQAHLADLLQSLARVAASAGRDPEAARLLGAAGRLRRDANTPLPPPTALQERQLVAALEARLGARRLAALTAEGEALTFAQAVAAAEGELVAAA